MVSDGQVTSDRWIRRRRKAIGGRRTWGGSGLAATPFREWKLRAGDSAGGSRGPLLGAGGGEMAAVSARKLAASLWRLAATTDYSGSLRWQFGLFDRLGFEFCSSLPISKFATEGVTKWDYCYSTAMDNVSYSRSNVKLLKNQEIATTSVASTRQTELFKARIRINELEAERGRLRTKLKYCMKKLNEEKASWMRTQHQKMRSIVKNLEYDVKRERRKSNKLDTVNSKLLSDIAEAKLSTRKFMQNLEKEKKTRELFEDVCNELAKEIEGKKAEIGALRNRRARFQEEVDKERKMLQIAEIWQEEQTQMKLANAKLILEDKYAQMNDLITDLEAFLRPSNSTTDENATSKAKFLKQAFDPVSIQGINMSTNIKNSQTSEAETRSAGHCFSYDQAHYASHHINPEVNVATRKSLRSNGSGFADRSGRETVTQAEIYSSQTQGGSEGSVTKIRSKYMPKCDAEGRKIAIHESQKSESSEISSVSLEGPDLECQWCSPDPRNPHVVRAMKGDIEWPRGTQRQGPARNLLQAKLQAQKTLLRNVLKRRS